MANTVSASHDARNPFHLREIAGWMARRVRRANVGTARNAFAALTATSPPRPVWPRTTPTPPPSAIAVTTTAADSTSWCQNRRRIPSGPHQLLDVVNHPKTWAKKPNLPPSQAPGRRLRAHGTASRWAPTRSRSATAASAIERTSPTMIGVL